MKIKRVTYIALGAFVFAASCSKEAAEPDVIDWADGEIRYRTSLVDIASSRAQDMTLRRLESFQVTCFNTSDSKKDAAGFFSPYFGNTTVSRHASGLYYEAEDPMTWPSGAGLYRFFAFSPSIGVMKNGNSGVFGIDSLKYFNLINTSIKDRTDVFIGYRLGTVRINPDISKQFDFVTASATGERWKDFSGGVDLAFGHRLCEVELRAWGKRDDYDFQIAGVRIGNPVVEGTYIFADDNTEKVECWELPDNTVMQPVDYLYQPADMSAPGDTIFRIASGHHDSSDSAASIMGNGGCAMVIPAANGAWEGLEDPYINLMPYVTRGMYFSILMRVTNQTSGAPLYPYWGNKDGMKVVSYVVDANDAVVARVYAGDNAGEYFSDPQKEIPYVAPEGTEIRDFGWAAVPVDADWSAGNRYVYTLNYSEGIGIHDPADPNPGKPIVADNSVSWSLSVAPWEYAEPDGATTDVTVPRK